MNIESIESNFLKKAKTWINDGHVLDVLYTSHLKDNKNYISNVFIIINTFNSINADIFEIRVENFNFGHYRYENANQKLVLSILEDAIKGYINLSNIDLELSNYNPSDNYSNISSRETWVSPLHIKLSGKRENYPSLSDMNLLENKLRASSPPFDGLHDLLGHLGLPNVINSADNPYIEIQINPPVDLIIDQSSLSTNILKLKFQAHINLDISNLCVAIRTLPGHSLKNRMQIASKIIWQSSGDKVKIGEIEISLHETDSVLVMLTIDTHTIRRHWIVDPHKSPNSYLHSMQHFDKNLTKIRNGIFEDKNSTNMEVGISNLFFMLGFSACTPMETESPDLLLSTPSGKIILVECTLKISDFSTKVGKLVDRRESLKKSFHLLNNLIEPIAIIISRQPSGQITTKRQEAIENKIVLLTQENLTELFQNLSHPIHPDIFIENELKKIPQKNNTFF